MSTACLIMILGWPWELRAAQIGGARSEVIEQARQAIGPLDARTAVTTLSIAMTRETHHVHLPPSTSRIVFDFALHDRFLQTLIFDTPMFGQPASAAGARSLRGFVADRFVYQLPPNERLLPGQDASVVLGLRRRASALLAALLLTDRTPIPLTYTAVGTASAGTETADVIEARSADGFTIRLFIDGSTRRVLMITRPAESGRGDPTDTWYFSGWKREGRLTFPRTIVWKNGQTIREVWSGANIRLNGPIPALLQPRQTS